MATNGTPEQPEQPRQRASRPSGGQVFNIPTKWLIIGGTGGGVVLAVVVVVALFLSGVLGGGSGASGGDNVLGYIPADAGGVLIGDNAAVLRGDVPEDFFEYLEESGEDSEGLFGAYEALDIDDDDVALVAFALNRNGDDILEIVQGSFDFDVIREELEDGLDCEDDDYRGFELWECSGQEFAAVALFEKDEFVVFARRQDDLEDVLTYKSRTPEKLADVADSDIKRILDQTEGGWLQVAYILNDCVINRCEGIAFALGESDDSESIPASYAVMFSSERAAESAEDDIAIDDLLEGMFAGFALNLDIEEVGAEEEFVVGNGTAEFVDPGETRSNRDGDRAPPAAATQPAPAALAATQPPAAPAPTATMFLDSSYASRGTWVDDCVHEPTGASQRGTGRAAREYCECVFDYTADELNEDRLPLLSELIDNPGGNDYSYRYASTISDSLPFCGG